MATDIVQSLFGVTPDMYQQQQARQADARALQFAQLTPMQQAQYGIGRGAYGLAGALGGALGAQDPELQRISMRQQIASQLRPDDLSTFDQGIEMMRQAGDGQGALMLQMERDKAQQLALVRQDEALVRQDAAAKRLRDEAALQQQLEAQARAQQAQSLLQSAYQPATPAQEQFVEVDEQGQPVTIPGRPASFNISSILPELMQSPEGRAAITELANLLPALRKLGAAGTPEVNPFTPFLTDETIPKNVQTYAQQLSTSFTSGILDPEKVDAKVKELSEMTQRAQQFQQNQDQIKAQQAQLNVFKEQGLANSQGYLKLAESTNALQADNAKLREEMQRTEAARKVEEDKRRAEERRLEAERKAEEARLRAEERKTEAERRAEEEKRRAEDRRLEIERKAEEGRLRAEERRLERERKIEEDKRRAIEAERAAEDRRTEAARRATEAQRAAEDRRTEADRRAEERKAESDRKAEAAKNKPLPGYLAKEEEADFSAASAASNIATDAYGYINRIKTGEIKFGVKDRASIRARQLFGSGDPDVIAREEYDKFVTNLVNESLRLNKGTQTEGDAVREAKALQSSESKEAAASAMKRLVEINTRRVEGAASSVEKRRANAGFQPPPQPITVPKFDVQIITPAEYNSFLKNPKFPSGTIFVDPDGVRRVKP
jgi:hypothetical protein